MGAVDAQGNLLVHPMTWLDERLFGWTRSVRGSSEGIVSENGEIIEPGPGDEDDDDDDTGDYDDVFGLLHKYEGQQAATKLRPKSGRSSYADLQQLRQGGESRSLHHKSPSNSAFLQLAPVYHRADSSDSHPQSPTATDVAQRTSPRKRRGSLSDSISVGRIGEVPPQESFKNATLDINRESMESHPERTA